METLGQVWIPVVVVLCAMLWILLRKGKQDD